MSLSEEDIQATARIESFKTKSLLADQTHHFRSRRVFYVMGDLTGLSDICVGTVPKAGTSGRFISLLDKDGYLDADIFIVPFEKGVLVDVHAELEEVVAARLSGLPGVEQIDRSANERWRVLGETPDQKTATTSFDTLRFRDSRRRELGSRILRDSAEPEGQDWRHSRKWDGHAMRLGILPDHRCVLGKRILPEEAGYHRLLGANLPSDPKAISRRILPIRVDTYSGSIPLMAGAQLLAGSEEIGVMLDQEGVCGVALMEIDPWRQAIEDACEVTCLDWPVLISWPTWLSSESEGRVGPAGGLI
ncbi:MAG: hypothetical protein AAFZ91_12690 [Pseudomonadota bacterium]